MRTQAPHYCAQHKSPRTHTHTHAHAKNLMPPRLCKGAKAPPHVEAMACIALVRQSEARGFEQAVAQWLYENPKMRRAKRHTWSFHAQHGSTPHQWRRVDKHALWRGARVHRRNGDIALRFLAAHQSAEMDHVLSAVDVRTGHALLVVESTKVYTDLLCLMMGLLSCRVHILTQCGRTLRVQRPPRSPQRRRAPRQGEGRGRAQGGGGGASRAASATSASSASTRVSEAIPGPVPLLRRSNATGGTLRHPPRPGWEEQQQHAQEQDL